MLMLAYKLHPWIFYRRKIHSFRIMSIVRCDFVYLINATVQPHAAHHSLTDTPCVCVCVFQTESLVQQLQGRLSQRESKVSAAEEELKQLREQMEQQKSTVRFWFLLSLIIRRVFQYVPLRLVLLAKDFRTFLDALFICILNISLYKICSCYTCNPIINNYQERSSLIIILAFNSTQFLS